MVEDDCHGGKSPLVSLCDGGYHLCSGDYSHLQPPDGGGSVLAHSHRRHLAPTLSSFFSPASHASSGGGGGVAGVADSMGAVMHVHQFARSAVDRRRRWRWTCRRGLPSGRGLAAFRVTATATAQPTRGRQQCQLTTPPRARAMSAGGKERRCSVPPPFIGPSVDVSSLLLIALLVFINTQNKAMKARALRRL